MKIRMFVGSVVVGALVSNVSVTASAADGGDYVGVKSCKMCHKKDDGGNQFGKWEATSHAKAFEVLGTPKAKEAGAKAGVADPQQSGKCLQCHSTAYDFTETKQTDTIPVEEGVSCESCHGAGKNYKSKEMMKNREECVKNGMIYPANKNCTKCHNEKSPSWNPEKYTTKDGKKVGFDPEQAYEKIKHPDPLVKK